jgi:HAD superfamily hydrolase (TIGR01509 family)
MPGPIRAIVFDFDGLILDTETPEVEAWDAEFARHDLAIPDGWWHNVTGRGPEEVLEWPIDLLERLLGRPVDEHSVMARVNRIRLEGIAAAEVRPGVVSLLDAADELGVMIGLASSSAHPWVDGHLKRLGLWDRFGPVVCRGDAPRAKPQPDLYLHCCQKLGIEPRHGLALEDSPNGIKAAKAAGMWCVAVPNDVTAMLDLSEADFLHHSLELLELSTWINPA